MSSAPLPVPPPLSSHLSPHLPLPLGAEGDPASADAGSRLWLSALADGEREALPHGSAQWRDDAGARECWHLYHLIGDVLRSDELASPPARDAAFLAGLRQRLAAEPVPLAPAAAPASPLRRLGWRAPAAVAAGFAAVAATLVLMRPEGFGVGIEGAQWAAGPASVAGGGVRVVSNPAPVANGPLVADGPMIRDARLDAYLRAHQSARGRSPVVLPDGGLRSVEILLVPQQSVPQQSVSPAARPASTLRPAAEPR